MIICNKCGENIGYFHKKYGFTDSSGNQKYHCFDCNEKYIREENEKQLAKEKEKNEKQLAREKEENEIRLTEITPILQKYFSHCKREKQLAIYMLYHNKKIFKKIKNKRLVKVEQLLLNYSTLLNEGIRTGKYDNLDEEMSAKKNVEIQIDFLGDLEKIYKLIQRKNIITNYSELVKIFSELFDEVLNQEDVELIKREYVRILNLLKDDISIKSVLREYIKTPFNIDINIDYAKQLLVQFNLKHNENNLSLLIEELSEEIELDNFEKNMGGDPKLLSLPDYNSMNGYQFEEFLLKLFEALGYAATQTKLSGDQGADLIVIKDSIKTAVQAKRYSGKVSNKAIQEVVAAKNHYKCDKSIVVTTGEFTKSAIELAMSNKVELWNNNKLEKIISEVNNSNNSASDNSQKSELYEEAFPVSCPYCKSTINIQLKNLPKVNEESKSDCPKCGVGLIIKLQEEQYTCPGCYKVLKTIKKRIEHINTCKKYEEKTYTCKYCNESIILDDFEFNELTVKGVITNVCPLCNKENIINR